ncbi:sensor histidine kinase [Anaerostipes sp.]|uniref:sensor histidine kinase n=1 Tax=Anaerostipes sp. TaxID=1872530 RepID=UPI003FF13A4E
MKTHGKQWENDLFISIALLLLATIIAHIFFYQSEHSSGNVPIIYVLATFLISRYTKGYWWGVVSSFLSVLLINWRFTYPYFRVNFLIDGYPMTFIGILVIAIITNMTTSSLNAEKEEAVKREKELEKLNEYNQQINELTIEKEKEKMRSNLLRAISHDLRTPLTGMIGASATYLEAKDYLDEKAKDQLILGIQEDAHWLLNMVENLLSVTRIQNDGSGEEAHVKKTPEPLEEVVAEAMQRFHKRYPESVVNVKIPDEFVMVPMDPTLIEQVIMNLLENAWVHSGEKAPVDFYIRQEEKNVVFYVRDYGKGIESERMDHLFDGCAGSKDHESRKGMGIGLSICKTIVLAHKGEIHAKNHEDGAEFSFSLPIENDLEEKKVCQN